MSDRALVRISSSTMLGDLVGAPSNTVRLYVGKLVAPLGVLFGVTISMGAPVGEAVDSHFGGDVSKEVGSPNGSLIMGEYGSASVVGAFMGFFVMGTLVGSFV